MKKMFLSLLIIVVVLVAAAIPFYFLDFSQEKINWGVTFSQEYAQDELGLDWRETYLAILDDLKIDHLRLSAYWKQNEATEGQYDFKDLDWQINQASQREVKIILAVGRRLPRWPECHDPAWLSGLPTEQTQDKQLDFVLKAIKRYQSNANIVAWQVENEPFLGTFGQCPPIDKNFLQKEIAAVRELDSRPIILTDSGELNWWVEVAKLQPDAIGTTLYRVVYNKYLGYFRWFLPPSFYYFKAEAIKKIFGIKEVLVAELQAESWHVEGKTLPQMSLADQLKSLDLKQFQKNISFTRKAGFANAYLWGAEWWYYLKIKQNYSAIWQAAQKLWQ